jgi:hypothetical protein
MPTFASPPTPPPTHTHTRSLAHSPLPPPPSTPLPSPSLSPPRPQVKFTPVIADHDFETKVRKVLKFVKKGHRCKISIQFKRGQAAMRDKVRR